MVAGFDTVFHRSLPPMAYNYALPADLVERHQIRRFGFHGPSHEYLLRRYCEITSTPLESDIADHPAFGERLFGLRYSQWEVD